MNAKEQIQAKLAELENMQKALNQQKLQMQADYKRMSEEKEKNNAELLQRSLQVAQATRLVVIGTIGSMQQFTLNDDWTVWHERLEQHFIANDVLDGKKVAVFITLLSAEAYTLLRDLCSPDVPSQKTIAQLATIMKDHLQPKPSCLTERYKFKERRQQAGENVKQYIASLKKLSMHCEFGNNLENQLRVEAASRDVAEMQDSRNSTDAANISYIARRKGKQTPNSRSKAAIKCFCCGKPNHKSSECRFREYECDVCHKKGHLKSVCKSKNNASSSKSKHDNASKMSEKNSSANACNYIDNTNEWNEPFERMFYLSDTLNKIEPYTLKMNVETNVIEFEIDSGSPITTISIGKLKEYENLRDPRGSIKNQ
ncbi:unnamed protein product [Trichogramma brassicae]|uniref:CCHC-type domain-containing protein n=1 Tax=Trichogramma brassicae TaxID=86971 RepID=A0A6H5IZR5_9HYME|nr:unnamed protein product [Trichogramma brassicae]